MSRPSPENVEFAPIPWVRINWNGALIDSGTFTNIGSTFGSYKFRRVWTGSVTPGWHSLSRRSKLKISTLDHDVIIQRDTGTPYRESKRLWFPDGSFAGTTTYDVANSVIVMGHPSATHLGEAYTKARARLAEKVNNMSINLAQAFGERKQTATLLVSTATRIALAARALRRAELGDFLNQLQLGRQGVSARAWEEVRRTPANLRLARHWLEFQYGWKPLLQDAFGAAELLAQHSQERYVTSNTGSATAREVSSVSSNDPTPTETLQSVVTKVKMSLCYTLDSAARAGLAQTGISNPALLAWELLPYSFVIDWFLPVGNYLQALDAFSGFQFVDGWVSQKTILTRQETWMGFGTKYWSGQWQQDGRTGQATTLSVRYTRTKLYAPPGVGKLEFKNPIGGDPLGRFLTAMSLMRVAFRK